MTQNDRTMRVLLITIVALLAANLLVNMNNSSGPRSAYADGIPDTGAQLQAIVDSVKDVGKKVDTINATLESGDITVKIKEDKK
ncbi:MAG TPA: hypothetical protein VM008_09950 [Phycisphaerae bacterium]|nr:hypothetical protein [Phycisphaerae bacterium]